VRSVPVTWDEMRILPGSKIGETVIVARRHGTDWHLAVLNCRAEPQTLVIDLSALHAQGDELIAYRDTSDSTALQIDSGTPPPADGKLTVTLRAGGGYLAHIRPTRSHGTW
jgi:alpha-glucosidase